MKKIGALMAMSLFLGLATTMSYAHCGKCASSEKWDKKISKKLGKMTKWYNLTAEQKPKVEAALRAKYDKKKEIKKEMHEKMSGVRSQFKSDMNAILNSEQRAKFEERMKKWEAKKKKKYRHKH